MVSDRDLQRRVAQRRLSVVNVAWEDTGRAEGSALGPNISDLSLQVRRKDERGESVAAVMPVIRQPNFADRTGDIPADRFFIRVGNEQRAPGSLRSVPLTDVLRNIKSFASRPDAILGDGNMFAARDSHFLVSAQAVFLPIPKSGKAQFNPVLFNYQSAPGSPAVLAILVTRQGSSMQVIENKGEDVTAAGWGQDNLFLIQIPLKHHNLGTLGGAIPSPPSKAQTKKGSAPGGPPPPPAAAPASGGGARLDRSDVEQAVLGHGPNVGPYNEGHGLRLERDPKFPIRITVQFYKATSNGVVSDIDLDSIAKSIGSVYEHADAVGSLVLPDGDPRRPTAWQNVPHAWFPW